MSNTEIDVEAALSEHKATLELIAALRKTATQHVCTRDEVLFLQGEPAESVYLVSTGEVKLMMPVSRTHAMVFRAEAGSLVGLPSAFCGQPYSMTAVAISGTELKRIGRTDFCELLVANPALSLEVLRILAEETRSARIAIAEVRPRHRGRGQRRRCSGVSRRAR
jgi:CRP-like cAMP-binding protein